MLPDSNIAAPNWGEWLSRTEGAITTAVAVAQFPDVVIKYKIGKQLIAGRWVYSRYDCEAAAVKIAAMRAERAAKQSVSP